MRRVGRGAFVLTALVLTAGCYNYSPAMLPPADAPNRALVPNTRITTTSGVVYHLEQAQVEGDSVIGSTEIKRARVAIAVRDVRTVEAWTHSSGKSAAAVGAGAGAVFVVAALVLGVLVLVGDVFRSP